MISACTRDCYDCCSIITRVKEGEITSIEGNRRHPVTQGVVCQRLRLFAKNVRSDHRLKSPLKREGPKCSGSFFEIDWDSAMKEIADHMKSSARTNGSSSVALYDSGGNMGLIAANFPHRLMNAINGSIAAKTICSAAGKEALKCNFGSFYGYPAEEIPKARLIVLWGINSKWTNIHGSMLVQKAKKNGASIWVIDPIKTKTAELGRHLQIKPGTDAVLALTIINQIIENNMHDSLFVSENMTGFENLIEVSKKYDSKRAAELTGLKISDIITLAAEFVSLRPCVIQIGFGMQRQRNGGEMIRTISLIPSILGQHRGFLYANGGSDFDMAYLRGTNLRTSNEASFNPLELPILLREGHIKTLLVINSNPLASLPNQNDLRKAIMECDATIVTHDLFMTDTADFSDYVLPATSMFEQLDIVPSYFHDYINLNERAIAPVGQSKSNADFFKALARGLGLRMKQLYENEEAMIEHLLKTSSRLKTSLSAMRKQGFVRPRALPLNRYPTPSGKIEIFSQVAADKGLLPLPGHYPIIGTSPFQLLSPETFEMNHSSYHLITPNISQKLLMNPKDAESLSIKNGQEAVIDNQHGSIVLPVEITDKVPEKIVVSYIGFWPKLSGGKNVNFVTSDYIQKFGNNSAYQSTFVNVRPA
ncbi:MAG: molybdopterin-dependent oxidoreductase [Thermoplasmata archaeon]|nr:molybdopterin-dependent oxidoreductase [Thermoplasmata archaeon]